MAHRFHLPVLMATPRMEEVVRMADDVVILHDGRMAGSGPIAQVLSDVSLSTFLEGFHAGSILEGAVTRHDIEWVVSEVDVSGRCVTVPATLHPVGTRVRLKVRARDVSLHREVPSDTSSTNVLRGRIAQVMLAEQRHLWCGGRGAGPRARRAAGAQSRRADLGAGHAPGHRADELAAGRALCGRLQRDGRAGDTAALDVVEAGLSKGFATAVSSRPMSAAPSSSSPSRRLLSVNVAQATPTEIQGRRILTAIGKQPVSSEAEPARIEVKPLGLVGDEQADLTVHGGLSKAVYAYPIEHYGFWQTVRAQAGLQTWGEALPPGSLART